MELPFALPFLKKSEVIALDIGSSSIKIVKLKQAKKGWELQKLGIAPLPPEAIVDGSIIDSMTVTETVTNLLQENKIKATDAVSALTGHSVIIKKVALAAMAEEELADSIQWEAEQYIPFPMTDVNIDFQILGEDLDGRGQMDVMLVAVKKDVINDYTNVIKEAGLTPVVVDVDSFALENMIEINYTFAPEESVAVVNIGASIMSLSVIVGGMTLFTRSTPMGGNQFTEEIQRQMNVSFSDAETLKLGNPAGNVNPSEVVPVIDEMSMNVTMEVKRSVDFFLSSTPGVMINKIFLSGGGAKTLGLVEMMQEQTNIPVEIVNPFNAVVYNPKVFDPGYLDEVGPIFGVAIGLATRRLGDR
ncbi:MAG: type IV pilus assembly protein PilM [Deltaproteobacteria bacterium]|nr:type IV pilus assembly protein PilM [Deltaproteobacteria bacterium]